MSKTQTTDIKLSFDSNKELLIELRKQLRVVQAEYIVVRDHSLKLDGEVSKAIREIEHTLVGLDYEESCALIDNLPACIASDDYNVVLREVGTRRHELQHRIKMVTFRMRRQTKVAKKLQEAA